MKVFDVVINENPDSWGEDEDVKGGFEFLEDAVDYIEHHSNENEENFFIYEMKNGNPVHFYDNKGKEIW